jgi:hypothetical protein
MHGTLTEIEGIPALRLKVFPPALPLVASSQLAFLAQCQNQADIQKPKRTTRCSGEKRQIASADVSQNRPNFHRFFAKIQLIFLFMTDLN